MEINPIIIGLGITVSILGFFLNNVKQQLVEIKTKVELIEKLLEDRRQDIKSIYDKINK